MKILLDTHIIIWLLNGSSNIPSDIVSLIIDQENEIYYSIVSILEIELKFNKSPDKILINGSQTINMCKDAGYKELILNDSHILNLSAINTYNNVEHKDPFDKLLLSQAVVEKYLFLTHDKMFCNYKYDNIKMI